MMKVGIAHDRHSSILKKFIVGTVISALALTSSPRTARADSPFAGYVIAFAIGVASGLVANAIYDTVTSDTTTTTTTTTTDSEGNTTTTTTTTTESSTPDTPNFFNISGTLVRDISTDTTIGRVIGRSHDSADILMAPDNIRSVGYKVERSVRTILKRKATFPKGGARILLDLNFDELAVLTRDILGTDGSSKMAVTISANGRVLYRFDASVEQGKFAIFSDEDAVSHIVRRAPSVLVLDDFKKRVWFDAEPGRVSDEIKVTILAEGVGKRIG
ncbi:MAG: hypothetical protein AB1489_24280 [Acidobacteriota bacterium]